MLHATLKRIAPFAGVKPIFDYLLLPTGKEVANVYNARRQGYSI